MRLRFPSLILLLIQLTTSVRCAPVRLGNSTPLHVNKQNGFPRNLTKSPNKFGKAEKKSGLHKKTTVSINGHILPMASMSEAGKTIHLTVQNAATPPGQQLAPSIQEVQTGGNLGGFQPPPGAQITPPNTLGIQNVGMSPGIPNPQTLGMSPGIPNPQTLGMSPGIPNPSSQNLGMSPGIRNPETQTLGMSPGIPNPGIQNLGMHPGIPNPGTQTLGMHPGINNNVQTTGISNQNLQNQGLQTNCALGNPNQVVLGTNSDGQLTYRPLACR